MRKFERFFRQIADIRSDMRNQFQIDLVKVLAGNSISNKRTPSVNQTIKYLKYKRKKKLANQLEAVYSVLKPEIVSRRLDLTRRTDAIDLTEFVNTYRHLVMNNKLYRRSVAIQLRKVE